jgi:hypothetical protein
MATRRREIEGWVRGDNGAGEGWEREIEGSITTNLRIDRIKN